MNCFVFIFNGELFIFFINIDKNKFNSFVLMKNIKLYPLLIFKLFKGLYIVN